MSTEKTVGWPLISDEELTNIQIIWSSEFDYTNRAAIEIAKEYGRKITVDGLQISQYKEDILETAAAEADVPYELLQAILNLTKKKWPSLEIYGAKRGLERDIEATLQKAAKEVESAAP